MYPFVKSALLGPMKKLCSIHSPPPSPPLPSPPLRRDVFDQQVRSQTAAFKKTHKKLIQFKINANLSKLGF